MKQILPKEYPTIKALAQNRVNVLLVGPSGCGKTFLAEVLARDLGMPFASVSCSAGMSESQLAGWLLPSGENGQFRYAPSPFVTTHEQGGVFLFDELDSADPNTLTFINAALANGTMHIPQRLDKPEVKRHPDCIILGAANTYGNGADMVYVGRNQLDGATLDRFRAGIVTMDYDAAVEEALVHPSVLAWGRTIRAKIRELGLRRIMSTRVLRDFTIMVAKAKWTQADCERAYFADWPEDERQRLGKLPWPEAKPKPKAEKKPKEKPIKTKPNTVEPEPTPEAMPDIPTGKPTITHNTAKNGIEIHFPRKPNDAVLLTLKTQKWRWAFRAKCWYKRFSPEAMVEAQAIVAATAPEPEPKEKEPEEKPIEPKPASWLAFGIQKRIA